MLHITLSSAVLMKRFGTNLFRMNAAYLYSAYPQIANKYGMDQELSLELKAS
jgi:hypothetical protein